METDIDLKNMLGILRRQIWVIASAIVVVLAITLLYLYTATPLYTASAKIIVDPAPKNLLKSDDGPTYSSGELNTRVDSEVEILKSDNSVVRVIKDKNLVADPEFGVKVSLSDRFRSILNLETSTPPSGDEIISRILTEVQNQVTVKRVGLTSVIEVSFRSKDPVKAADMANSLVQSYIDLQLSSKVAGLMKTRDNFAAQAVQANANIVQNEKKFDDYLDLNLAKIEKNSGSLNLAGIRQEIEAAKRNSQLAKSTVDSAEAALQKGNVQELVTSLNSQALAELQKKKDALNQSLVKAATETENNDLRQQLAKVDASLNMAAKIEIDKLKDSISEADRKADDLRGNLRSEILKSNLPPEVLADIYTIQQNSQIAQTQYQTLLARQQELDTKAQLVEADSRIVNQAIAPLVPSFPNKRLIFAIAVLLGIAVGGAIAVVREYFVGGFTNEEQVNAVLGFPLVAVIPRQTQNKGETLLSVADKVALSPLSVFAESIRRLRIRIEGNRTQVDFKNATVEDSEEAQAAVAEVDDKGSKEINNECRVIMVGSSEPNEGKSTIALSLGRTLAVSGNRVLLVDCDLRKPSIHKLVGIEASTWLSYILRFNVPMRLMQYLSADPLSPLKIITNSREHDYVTDDLVMSPRFAEFLGMARKHFDYIVIDTPPVVPVVDALYIARHVDVVAFVLRWAQTSQLTAKKALTALSENVKDGTDIVVVMSQKDEMSKTKYNKYSDYYTSETAK